VTGESFVRNDLPVMTLAEDRVTFRVTTGPSDAANEPSAVPDWMRWNDYGIGLLRGGELRGAERAFREVERHGRPDGPLNLARVYLREGRVADDAPAALRRAADFEPAADEWTLLWLAGLVDKQNGRLQEAVEKFRQIIDGGFAQAAGRDFDFSRDDRLLNELAQTLYLQAKQQRGESRRERRRELLEEAATFHRRALDVDPENVAAHYGLKLVYTEQGDAARADEHDRLHALYKPDDNARDHAVAQARIKYPAANRAAEDVVIYDLHRREPVEPAKAASADSGDAAPSNAP
jgi:tetratricopeptide (TPR) repeat protein